MAGGSYYKNHIHCVWEFSRSVVSDSLRPCGLGPARLLCPGDSPGRNTGVGCHSLLQGVFPTQGLSMRLLHWQTGSLHHLGSPKGCLKGARPSKWVRHHHLCLASLRQAGLGRSFMEEKREGSMCALLGGCFGGKLEVATNCRRDILMG